MSEKKDDANSVVTSKDSVDQTISSALANSGNFGFTEQEVKTIKNLNPIEKAVFSKSFKSSVKVAAKNLPSNELSDQLKNLDKVIEKAVKDKNLKVSNKKVLKEMITNPEKYFSSNDEVFKEIKSANLTNDQLDKCTDAILTDLGQGNDFLAQLEKAFVNAAHKFASLFPQLKPIIEKMLKTHFSDYNNDIQKVEDKAVDYAEKIVSDPKFDETVEKAMNALEGINNPLVNKCVAELKALENGESASSIVTKYIKKVDKYLDDGLAKYMEKYGTSEIGSLKVFGKTLNQLNDEVFASSDDNTEKQVSDANATAQSVPAPSSVDQPASTGSSNAAPSNADAQPASTDSSIAQSVSALSLADQPVPAIGVSGTSDLNDSDTHS